MCIIQRSLFRSVCCRERHALSTSCQTCEESKVEKHLKDNLSQELTCLSASSLAEGKNHVWFRERHALSTSQYINIQHSKLHDYAVSAA